MDFLGAMRKAGITVENVQIGSLDDGSVVDKHLGHGKIGAEDFFFPTCTSYEIKDGRIFEVRSYVANQHGVDRYLWARVALKDIPARLAS